MRYLVIAILGLLVALPGFAEPTPEPAPEPAPAPTSEEADADLQAEVFKDFDTLANHYKCYQVQQLLGQFYPPVSLSDQFKQSEAQVLRPRYLCNPVKKNDTGIVDEDLHYVCFDIVQDLEPPLPDVRTSNQFGTQYLRPIQTELLCLPSKKVHL